MDTTPSRKMFDAMQKFTDAMCGDEPSKLDHGSAARAVRAKRSACMDFLHGFHSLAMREGVNRAVRDAQARRDGPRDMQDRNAIAKAVDDAVSGARQIVLPDGHQSQH